MYICSLRKKESEQSLSAENEKLGANDYV